MTATVAISPNPAPPGSTVILTGSGFAPKARTKFDDQNVFRTRPDGGFSVGFLVSSTPKLQSLTAQQQSAGTWTNVWKGSITVQDVVVVPPATPNLQAVAGDGSVTLSWS